MSNINKPANNASLYNTVLGDLTLEQACAIELEYRKNGYVKASSLVKDNIPKKPKKYKSKARTAHTLTNFREWKRDICYISSELSNIASYRNTNVAIDQPLIRYATKTVSQISDCLASITYDPKSGKLNDSYRCKSHACPYCNHVKQSVRQDEFDIGLQHTAPDSLNYKYTALITVRFIDRASTHKDVTSQLKQLNTSISKLLGYRKYRKIITGSVRSIEVIEDNKQSGKAHVHMHILASVNHLKTIYAKELREKLESITKKRMYVHIQNKIKADDGKEQLVSGFNYLHKAFGLKTNDSFSTTKKYPSTFSSSSVRRQSAEFYIIMLRGIKGQRLYNSTGIFRKILKLGKDKAKSRRSHTHNRNHTVFLNYLHRPTVTDKGKHYDLGYFTISHLDMEYFIHELDKYDIRVRAKTYAHNNVTHDNTKIYAHSIPPNYVDNNPPNTSDQLILFSADNNAIHDDTSNLWALKLKKDD